MGDTDSLGVWDNSTDTQKIYKVEEKNGETGETGKTGKIG